MTKPRRPAPVKHLLRHTENELGGMRYHAACGYSGVSSRDFSANFTKQDRDGRVIWLVTCNVCINGQKGLVK